MSQERVRPLKQFRVIRPYGPYVKGNLIQPTGLYRDALLRRGVIEEVTEPAESPLPAREPMQHIPGLEPLDDGGAPPRRRRNGAG